MPSYELDKAYSPSKYEADLYKRWEDSGAFKPDPKATKDPFTIIMPPPNANGDLHLGHAMFVVEDIMIRYRRMQGHPTLWLPGADHAGIETQVMYERQLAKDGRSRFDLGREEFYKQTWDFSQKNMHNMMDQVRQLGFSVDWSRFVFTLDDKVVATVYETFKQLHDADYIYRGNRIVNWCPSCRSAFADIEVKYREQIDPLYYIKYGPFVLATVRPETKFGDTAIAVNPKDERYKDLIGKTIDAEDLNGPIKLQVIGDAHIDPEFGTGAMKVTPAHDPNDWEIGLRHNLEVRAVIGTDGLLNERTGKYAGMPVAEAREQVAHDLEERGLMDHIDMNYTHSVGYHDRCGTQIEPLVVEQWWMKVDELKKPAIKAIKEGQIKFVPERFTKVALDWLENLHDWNISRQNWWGIRIPVYYNNTSDESKPEYIIGTEEEAIKTYGQGGYEAETDNFDTWFSSGQWPFATLMATGDFEKGFYPTSVMETGRDILFLWVTRMIMFGLFKTKKVPFRTVYLHGLVTDEHGKKMSKSKNNGINPLEMTAKYGTDAVRLALTIGITPGNDGALGERKIEGYRNFCNKLWNVARFILGQFPENYSPARPVPQSPADAWILARTNDTVREVTKAIEDYRFSEAGQAVYSLLWDDFADWYIEASKVEQNTNILYHVLSTIVTVLHPFAPFVTEAIWNALPGKEGQLITTVWPQAVKAPAELKTQAAKFEDVKAVVQATRAVAAEEQLSKPVILTTNQQLADSADLVARLARAGAVKQVGEGSGLYLGTTVAAWIEANAQLVANRRHRLESQRDEKQTYLKGLEAKLANENYTKNAPAAVVQETRDRREETKTLLAKITEQLTNLG
ncbi:MAG TPA: valine--tRNA ligase [Candidatus Saccharimonadia bacterium]|jgi:valyl-tRNA synthetase|nr:valine--tRNA ligase [Candidatus Saccharimonadia bacterium]